MNDNQELPPERVSEERLQEIVRECAMNLVVQVSEAGGRDGEMMVAVESLVACCLLPTLLGRDREVDEGMVDLMAMRVKVLLKRMRNSRGVEA